MKKLLCLLAFAVLSLTINAQRYYSSYYPSYYGRGYSYASLYSPITKNPKPIPGVRFSWPVDCALSLGVALVNAETPEYNGEALKKDYFTIGGHMCGLVFSFGTNFLSTNESVYGYSKTARAYYTKWGLELGKVYITTNNGNTHSFSIAPTYTKIWYGLGDDSGNNIGWTSYDNQKRREFYDKYPDTFDNYLGGWGITLNYSYEYFGIDISISKKVIEISLIAQIDLNPWIHSLRHM